MNSRLPLVAVAAVAALTVVACGDRPSAPGHHAAGHHANTASTSQPRPSAATSPPPASPSSAPPSSPAASASPPTAHHQAAGGQCAPGSLTISQGRTQGAAGSEYDDFAVSNAGSARCTVRGYPKLVALDSSGRKIPVRVAHDGPTPKTVPLDPGAKATLTIRTSHVTCHSPTSAAAFDVTLPGAGSAKKLAVHDVTVCRGGVLHERALQPPG